MVEGAGLENRYTRKGIAGSNPALSASFRYEKAPRDILGASSFSRKTLFVVFYMVIAFSGSIFFGHG